MNERLRKLPPYPMVALEQQKRLLLAQGKTVYDFGTGDPQEEVDPKIRAALTQALGPHCGYPSVQGQRSLRLAIAGYLQRRFGVVLDPDAEILPTMGSKEALFHLPQTLVEVPSDKDLVLYGEPAYPVYEIGALFAEAWTYAIPLGPHNGYCPSPEDVPAASLRRAAVVFLNSPHNPSGQTMSAERLHAWVAARDEFGFVLVNDECYADLYFGGEPPHSVLEFGKEGCLAVHSLSKRSGMTGYRSGFVAGCPDTIAHYRRFRASMGLASQDFVQAAATAAWSDDAHVAARRAVFGQKRAVLQQGLSSLGLETLPNEASIYLWVKAPGRGAGVAYAARCAEQGILVAPGAWFGPGQEDWFRLALVPSVQDCQQALSVWPRS